jgi:hypothetical protein
MAPVAAVRKPPLRCKAMTPSLGGPGAPMADPEARHPMVFLVSDVPPYETANILMVCW